MRKLKYILLFILSASLLNSCLIDDTTSTEDYDSGPNVVTFESITNNSLTCTADGSEYQFRLKVKIVGPTVMNLKSDITVTVASDNAAAAIDTLHTVAIEGDEYRIDNKTITLTAANNYLGIIVVTLMTAGNAAPMEGTPEFDTYKSPKLCLTLSATGDTKVVATGKIADYVLNFTPPNPYAGNYDVELRYFHPTAGGSYPTDPVFDPNNPYGGIRSLKKTLTAVTGRKCETGFAVWPDTDKCWITVNADNSIGFSVWDGWSYDVKLGNPYDPSQVSHFDPVTRKIYLYYYYAGADGKYRIFWEVFTPKF